MMPSARTLQLGALGAAGFAFVFFDMTCPIQISFELFKKLGQRDLDFAEKPATRAALPWKGATRVDVDKVSSLPDAQLLSLT
jgi:hypothetical protein